MNSTIKLIVAIIYQMCGNNTFKVLRNWPNKVDLFLKLGATFDKLSMLNHNDSIVCRNDRVKDYQFIKSKVLELMNQNYVVLNDSFISLAELEGSEFRLAEVYFKPDYADGYYTEWFKVEELDRLKTQTTDIELLSASEWNGIWQNVAYQSNKNWQFESFNKKPLIVNQLPGVIDAEIDEVPRLLHDFQNDSEHSFEFIHLLHWNNHTLGKLSPSTEILTESWIKSHLNIEKYLFDDFRN